MAIGVVIKRVAKPGADAKVLLPHIIELRALALRQPDTFQVKHFLA